MCWFRWLATEFGRVKLRLLRLLPMGIYCKEYLLPVLEAAEQQREREPWHNKKTARPARILNFGALGATKVRRHRSFSLEASWRCSGDFAPPPDDLNSVHNPPTQNALFVSPHYFLPHPLQPVWRVGLCFAIDTPSATTVDAGVVTLGTAG